MLVNVYQSDVIPRFLAEQDTRIVFQCKGRKVIYLTSVKSHRNQESFLALLNKYTSIRKSQNVAIKYSYEMRGLFLFNTQISYNNSQVRFR